VILDEVQVFLCLFVRLVYPVPQNAPHVSVRMFWTCQLGNASKSHERESVVRGLQAELHVKSQLRHRNRNNQNYEINDPAGGGFGPLTYSKVLE
jgi:hypothetical protein